MAKQIKFDYLKSNLHRVVFVQGLFGGVTPNGYLHMALYNQRGAIPLQTTHPVSEDGKVGDEDEAQRVVRETIVREVEVSVMMDLSTAKAVHEWLGARVRQLEDAHRARLDGVKRKTKRGQ